MPVPMMPPIEREWPAHLEPINQQRMAALAGAVIARERTRRMTSAALARSLQLARERNKLVSEVDAVMIRYNLEMEALMVHGAEKERDRARWRKSLVKRPGPA